MDFRASGVRSLKLNIFLILKEVKTNLILRSASQKRLSFTILWKHYTRFSKQIPRMDFLTRPSPTGKTLRQETQS